MASPELIALLSRKLLAKYRADTSITKELIPNEGDLADFLKELIKEGKLKLGSVTEASEFTVALLDRIKTQIKRIQGQSGILAIDGILGLATKRWFDTRKYDHHAPGVDLGPTAGDHVNPDDGLNAIRFHVEGRDFKDLRGLTENAAMALFAEAADSWRRVCNIVVRQDPNPATSNIIVRVRPVRPNKPSVVAVAGFGPPRGRKLEIAFDVVETWDPHKFEAAAAHEFGHILGIDHIAKPRQLMNDTLHNDIKTPQDADEREAVAIWGAPE